jgi:hypothetical protein
MPSWVQLPDPVVLMLAHTPALAPVAIEQSPVQQSVDR